VLHSPAMEEWLWWLKFYAAVCVVGSSFFGGLYWVLNKISKKFDSRTEGIVRTVLVGVIEAFNYEFSKRDDKLLMQETRIDSIEANIIRIALAGKSLAGVSLHPTDIPSRRERQRIIDHWDEVIKITSERKFEFKDKGEK